MATVDASKKILTAGADYSAEDWARVGAEAALDFKAQAQLLRGFDLGIGADAGVRIEGGLQKFLSADVQGQANAAAGVRAQVQVPLDLFNEAGLAIRLQAIAEAAAGVSLAIGLKAGDFLALAGQDPRMRGVPIELLKVFLHELNIEGGVMAKVAVAAMAYANLAITGRLTKSNTEDPGFTIAAEAGIGLKAGAGFRVFARFRVADPRNLIRRSVDIAVDGGINNAMPLVPAAMRSVLDELRTPAKIALRAAFEVGLTLTDDAGQFNANDGSKLTLRCVQVALEEAQRQVLERAVEFASNQLCTALRGIGFDDATWLAAAGARHALADRLRALPEEPFEASAFNRDYWNAIITEAGEVANGLTGGGAVPPSVQRSLALIWSTTQLLFISVERISNAEARAAIIGMPPAQATAAYAGNLPQPPATIQRLINSTLGRDAGVPLVQPDIVKFFVRTIQESPLLNLAPELRQLLMLIAGPNGDAGAEVLDVIFNNLGAFVRGADGTVSAQASLAVLRDSFRAFLDSRIAGELRPALEAAAGSNLELRTFLDEVVINTLHTVTGPIFDTLLSWRVGDQDNHRALRELCSSLVLGMLGRSLIVVGDVLLAKAQESIQLELTQVATHVNDNNGLAPTIAGLTHLDRGFVAEVIEETLLVCANTLRPMAAERRARFRDLMYQVIDTAPAADNPNAIADLRNSAMIPNSEAAFELVRLMGEEIVGNLIKFVEELLTRIAAIVLEELQEFIASIQRTVEEWISGLESLAAELREADFAIFVMAPVDRTTLRGKRLDAIRDNVLFELGLFAGHLGRKRTFLVMPRDRGGLRIPTDVLGLTPAEYDAKRHDKNLVASLGPACNKIRKTISKVKTGSGSGLTRAALFTDFDEDAELLLENCSEVVLYFIHSRRWRETHGDTVNRFLARAGSKLKVFLPDLANEFLIRCLIIHFDDGPAIPGFIADVYNYFAGLSEKFPRKVEIRLFSLYPTYTFYKFDDAAIIAMYPTTAIRKDVPTFRFKTGGTFGEFLAQDIAELIKQSKKVPPQILRTLTRKAKTYE